MNGRSTSLRIAMIAPAHEIVSRDIRYGGTERVIVWLSQELISLGHRITIFACEGSYVPGARMVSYAPGPLRKLGQEMAYGQYETALMLELVKRQHEFDLFHFHLDSYVMALLPREILARSVTTCHGRLDTPSAGRLFRQMQMPLIAISESQRQPVPGASWYRTIHHGMPEDSLLLGPGGKPLGFLGRISPEKGFDIAVEIARRVGLQLHVAAKIDRTHDRAYIERCEELLRCPWVTYVGEIDDAGKQDFLGNIAALISPVQWPEPFGLVTIEAMATGTPVVAYNCGALGEVVRDGVNGFLIESEKLGRDASIAAATELVRKAVPRLNRKWVRDDFRERFSARRMAGDYDRAYRQLVGNRSRTNHSPLSAYVRPVRFGPGPVT